MAKTPTLLTKSKKTVFYASPNDDGGDNKSEFHGSDKILNHVEMPDGPDKIP